MNVGEDVWVGPARGLSRANADSGGGVWGLGARRRFWGVGGGVGYVRVEELGSL